MNKPLLSIGIIFKNEIRCLERCLKSLEPLREAIPCELVMADTGSTDGSRMVAEKYADILFDFEWINDFAAARNAVMDRCSGKWYFSIDCDEWLNDDIQELVDFVTTNQEYKYCGLTVRNYQTADLDKGDEYSDFYACRMILMSTGLRYVGAIHERWPTELDGTPKLLVFRNTLLHHDGYLHIDAKSAKEKSERNMALLRKHLEEDPENITTLMQCIESSDGTPEFIDYVKAGAKAVEERWQGWNTFGAPILRYAAMAAYQGSLTELEPYIDMARELFPNSIYTRIDVEFAAFALNWKRKEYGECIQNGERYLKGLADYEAKQYDYLDSLSSTLAYRGSQWKNQVLIFMAASYLYEKQPSKAVEILNSLTGEYMSVKNVKDSIRVYAHLHSRTGEDTETLIVRLWEQISQPIPTSKRAEQRKNEFIRMSSEVFLPAYQEDEQRQEEYQRPAYTLFLPLRGKCVLGDMAAILDTSDAGIIEEILSQQEHYDQLSAAVLLYALDQGVRIPLPGKPLKLEELDGLASRLAQDQKRFLPLALKAAEQADPKDWQNIVWVRGLVMAAVRTYPWSAEDQDEEQGMALARAFAEIEGAFLPLCYAPEALQENRLFALPPMHRFGWWCAQAFSALERGRAVEYVRLLRSGLDACEGIKEMVEFLINHTQEVQQILTPPELRSLADQVRVILARFDPSDPAVEALKQSEAYQKVAHIIDAPAVLTSITSPIKIFTFWEPEGNIPAYLQLCMKTWKKFIPNAEIHILHFGNIQKYADFKGVYGPKIFSSGYSLPQISDAVRAIVLEHNGGIWMDVDTIILKPDFEKYLQSPKEVSFFGYPEKKSVHIAWIRAKKHAKLMQDWVAGNAYRIQNLKQSDKDDEQFWSYLGNGVVDLCVQDYPEETEVIDVIQENCVPERKIISGNLCEPYRECRAYREFYFKKSLHIQDIHASLLLLHNSWTPSEYRDASEEELFRYDCTMTNILRELL